jgi:putative membrane protein
MFVNRRILVAGFMLFAAAVPSCTSSDTDEEAVVEDTGADAAPVPAGPSDADIAHIVVTANTIDIEAGRLAGEKSQNAEVKAFGARMVTDHTAVNEQATQLASRLSLTPTDNGTSQSLKTSADQTMLDLRGKSGADFDRAYIDHEVAYHQQVLDAIDTALIPNAQNAELRALLEQTRPAIASHLEMAKQIQTKLSAQ